MHDANVRKPYWYPVSVFANSTDTLAVLINHQYYNKYQPPPVGETGYIDTNFTFFGFNPS